MNDFSNVNVGRRRFLRLGVFVSTAALIRGVAYASEEKAERRYFNVPKGEAIKSLKLAAKQAKVEFLLSADMLKGIETKKIRGRFTPIEAFSRMLLETDLAVVRHEKSGAYSIKKNSDLKTVSQEGNPRP